MNSGASPHDSNTREQHKAHENQSSLSSSGMQGQRAWGYGLPGTRLFDKGSPRPMTKIDPSLRGKGTPLLSEPQR
jgi:hypothetical protein